MQTILNMQIKAKKKLKALETDSINLIKDFGPEGDAYSGPGERQITILGKKDINDLRGDRERGICIKRFTANIIVSGSSGDLNIGQKYKIGESIINISNVSKNCHSHCPLIEEDNRVCLLPEKARFASVEKSGKIKIDDKLTPL